VITARPKALDGAETSRQAQRLSLPDPTIYELLEHYFSRHPCFICAEEVAHLKQPGVPVNYSDAAAEAWRAWESRRSVTLRWCSHREVDIALAELERLNQTMAPPAPRRKPVKREARKTVAPRKKIARVR